MEIQQEHVEMAYHIMEWHLNESKRMFGETRLNQAEHDARLIATWLLEGNHVETSLRNILRESPVKDKNRRDKAVTLLERTHHITLHSQAKSKATTVMVNPSLF